MARRRTGRRKHPKKSRDDSSSCSCSSCDSGSDSSSATSRTRSKSRDKRSKSKRRSESRSRTHSRQTSRDHKTDHPDPIARAVTPELHPSHLQAERYPPIGPSFDSMGKQPKIAMILLLGREEREFRLTEAQILYDSPNDLTSTYYASDPSDDSSSGTARTYRMPDRDPGIFEIIYRYMNREQVIPLRKSHCPKYLSYEQTEIKLAEEAKFYRLTRLSKGLPKPGQGEPPPPMTSVVARDYAQSSGSGRGGGGGQGRNEQTYLPPPQEHQQYQHHPPSHLPSPALTAPPSLYQAQAPSMDLYAAPPTASSHRPPTAPSAVSEPSSRHPRTHSRHSSSSSSAPTVPKPPKAPPQHLYAFLFRGDAPTRTEPPFPIIDYPDDSPLPHLFVKATNAEIKFSAFRNAVNQDQFELRYSIRILDEPATRPLAFRLTDSTIKSVDSHLRLNGVITDLEARDIPIKIQHALSASSSSSSSPARKKGSLGENGTIAIADDSDGCLTSGLDELLDLMSTKGYVKWPRVFQDSFDNITPPSSLHQRVCLTSCEVLFDLEFPEESAQISAEVGGRGFVLRKEEEEDLMVRNYRVNLWGVKCGTRKMRRLRSMEEVGSLGSLGSLVLDEGRQLLKAASRGTGGGIPDSPGRMKAASDVGSSVSTRGGGYRPAAHYASGSRSDVGSSVSQRQENDSLMTPRPSHHLQQPSYAGPSLSVPQSARPRHTQQPSYSFQRSDVSSSSRAGQQQYAYPPSPSVVSNTHLYPSSPVPAPQGMASDLRPPRGHYHPNLLPPDTPQTWSNPQLPHPHPQLKTQRPPASPLGGSEYRYPAASSYAASSAASARADNRRGSEPHLGIPGQGQGGQGYTSGGRPRSSSAMSGMSVRTTASEEIRRRALERWDR